MNTKVLTPNFTNPLRLTEAREAKGLTMAELARVLGVSRQAVSSFEKGLKYPSHETLMSMARILGFPERFFVSELASPDIEGAVHFRSQSTATRKARMSGRSRGRWVALILSRCAKYAQLPAVELPDFDIEDFESLDKTDIEELATRVRRYWQLGDGPIMNLTTLLENKGVVISHLPSGEKVDAFSFWDGERPIVVLDKSKTAVRMRFSLAHELGHLIMHRSVENDYLDDKQLFNLVERQADYFASCFLLPEATFAREYYSPSLTALEQLKKRWVVSIAGLAMRAHDLDIMSDNQKVYVFRQLAAFRRKEPLDDVLIKEKPLLINKLLKLLDRHGLIKTTDLIEIFGLPATELMAITQLSEADLTQSDNVVSFVLKR